MTLAPTQVTASEATVVSETGADGKPTLKTSHFLSTFTSTPISTTISRPSTATDGASSASSGAAANQGKSHSGGLSTGGKVTIGILIPLCALAIGGAIAFFLIRKHRKDKAADAETPPGMQDFSAPMAVSGSPKDRFSSLKFHKNAEHPDHEPFNVPALPTLPTPRMSMLGGATLFGGSTAGDRRSVSPEPVPDLSAMGAAGAGTRAVSTYSTISSVSAYSEQSRYSQASMAASMDRPRSPSPPPPLPEIPAQHSNFLDVPAFGAAASAPAPEVHPYDTIGGDSRLAVTNLSDRNPADANSFLSFTSDHPSQSPSKAPSMTDLGAITGMAAAAAGTNRNSNRDSFATSMNRTSNRDSFADWRPASEHNERSSKYLSGSSAISDAAGADARATQLFYPFGEQLMTPGGRIVPRPVGQNPKNINPGLGGMRADGSRPGRSNSFGGLGASAPGAAPRLPQLPEAQEDGGLGFDFGSLTTAGGSSPPPVMHSQPLSRGNSNSSAPLRPKAPTPSPSPPPPLSQRPSIDSVAPGRSRAPSQGSGGYRQYRADNLL